MKFENITNPGALPVDGDTISYEVYGRSVMVGYDLGSFKHLLNLADEERENGLSPIDFRRLFTFNEMLTLDNAEYSDTFTAQQKATIRTAIQIYKAAISIHLDHPETQILVRLLVSFGILTQDRSDAILSGVIPS